MLYADSGMSVEFENVKLQSHNFFKSTVIFPFITEFTFKKFIFSFIVPFYSWYVKKITANILILILKEQE
jgi:hypothetical protein